MMIKFDRVVHDGSAEPQAWLKFTSGQIRWQKELNLKIVLPRIAQFC